MGAADPAHASHSSVSDRLFRHGLRHSIPPRSRRSPRRVGQHTNYSKENIMNVLVVGASGAIGIRKDLSC